MQQVITAKLKLLTTPEQFAALRKSQLAYRDALNYASQYAYAHGKTSNKVAIQDGTYYDMRAQFHLPAQMACSVARQVGATYKALWTKVKQNAEQRKAGKTKNRYKGLDQAPKYVSPTLTYQYGKDYSFKKNQQVSILSLNGRVVVSYRGYNEHLALIERGECIRAAKLWYDKPKKQFYLLVSLTLKVNDPDPEVQTTVVGVDVGIRYLATTATLENKTHFFSGKKICAKANHYARVRKRLQRKGTRSATRRLVVLSGRERRLKQDANHTIAKRITSEHPHALIGLEYLTYIRERTRRRKRRRKKNGKGTEPVSKKQRRANRVYSQWSFAELQSFINYKAVLADSFAITVDANYTSQACPMCGHTCEENRPGKGLLFVCQQCRYTLHADLVGARNIAMRTLLIRQVWVGTGQLSFVPDVSTNEAKAARLAWYAELRWT